MGEFYTLWKSDGKNIPIITKGDKDDNSKGESHYGRMGHN